MIVPLELFWGALYLRVLVLESYLLFKPLGFPGALLHGVVGSALPMVLACLVVVLIRL